jgi:hypothetical protein
MTNAEDKLSLDTHLLDVYLTGLQAEVEAKLRRVKRFREQMQKIDAAGGPTDQETREKIARALIAQAKEMLETNLIVRDTLQELLATAQTLLKDVQE